MKLDRLILVNWGALRSGEYPLGTLTLLTGPTGAGKTTLLDALQTLMSATYPGLYNYNPGQEESSQNTRKGKSKRTLWSYIVGAEDNLFARPGGAHGYVVGIFRPDEGEDAKPFAAVVGAAARVEDNGGRRQAVQERLSLLLVDGAELTLPAFLEEPAPGVRGTVPVEAIDKSLRRQGFKTTVFQDGKREFLCHLYGRFRGLRSVAFSEAERAARAWCHSIGNRPIGSVDELIRSQVLEFDAVQFGQRISQVTDLMRQVRGLRQEGERLTQRIECLEELDARADEACARYRQSVSYQLFAARLGIEADEAKIDSWLKAASKGQSALAEMADDRRLLAVGREALQENLIEAMAALQGAPVLADQARAQALQDQAQSQIQGALSGLRGAARQTRDLCLFLIGMRGVPLPESIQVQWAPLAQEAERLLEQGQPLFALCNGPDLAGQPITLDSVEAWECAAAQLESASVQLFDAVLRMDGGLVTAVQTTLAVLGERTGTLAERGRLLKQQAHNVGHSAPYPSAVSEALGVFSEMLPAARPLVLCDLVDVEDRAWRPAIEGYLGLARFGLIVPPEYEESAIDLVRARRLKVRVIQGARCLERYRPERVADESIVRLLRTEHPIARAYLGDAFGDVIRIQSVEALRKAARGVMIDGRACGAKTLYVVHASPLVLGAEARKAAALNLQAELGRFNEELQQYRAQQSALEFILERSRGLARADWRGLSELRRSRQLLEQAQERLMRELSGDEAELRDEVALLRAQLKKESDALEALNKEYALLEARVQSHTVSADELQGQVDEKKAAALKVEQQLASLCEQAGLDPRDAAPARTAHLKKAEDALEEARALEAEALDMCARLWVAVGDYNRSARGDEALRSRAGGDGETRHAYSVGSAYDAVISLRQELAQQLGALKSVGLVRNLDQLMRAETSFKDVFVRQFCFEIRNAVDSGVRSLRALNLELENWKFGADRFSIDWSVWVPEFRDYYSFFVAAHELSESPADSIFDATSLGEAEVRARDRLLSLMLSSDLENAQAELMRIADYRNYRRYEIWKQSESGARVALSEWGTGSGGQLETPAYIVRAAVVTHRLRCFEPGPSLKLLVNDESFAKMDEPRARSVLHFIRDGLGAQLICAMPTKHAGGLRPEFSREYAFSRAPVTGNGEVDFMSEVDARVLHTDKLQLLWEEHRRTVREAAAAAPS